MQRDQGQKRESPSGSVIRWRSEELQLFGDQGDQEANTSKRTTLRYPPGPHSRVLLFFWKRHEQVLTTSKG